MLPNMERKANQFVHKLAEKLIKSSDVEQDNDTLKSSFREVVKAMEHGRLKKELQRHFSLYFKKLMHKMNSNSSFERKPQSPGNESNDSTTGLDLTASQTPGSLFNLYTTEQKKKLIPSTERDVLWRLCLSSKSAAIKLISDHFEDKMSFSQLKDVSRIMIGQKEPEIVFKYLSMVVTNIGTELEPALSSGNEERCADFHSFIHNLLTIVHHKIKMTGMSFPSNWSPRIESLLAALLSMLVDLSAVLSRSSDDNSSQRSQQLVTQVLLHLEHSPSHLLDVLLQLSASSQDAGFLVPLFRRILCQYRTVNGNCDFVKYVCAVRLAKKTLASVIPTDVDNWSQESAGQWLRQLLEKNKQHDTKDIVKLILERADDDEVEELLNILVSTEADAAKEDETEEQGETDLFFVDKSQDDIQNFGMFEEPGDTEIDSDLDDEINLADELLAELDSGKLSSSRETGPEEDEMKTDDVEVEQKEIDNESGHVIAEPMDTSEDPTSSSSRGQRSRSPELFAIQEEVSFEEMRAKALGLDGKDEDVTGEDEDKERETEADDENSEDEEEEEEEEDNRKGLEEGPSQTKVEEGQAEVRNQGLSTLGKVPPASSSSSSEDEEDEEEDNQKGLEEGPSQTKVEEGQAEVRTQGLSTPGKVTPVSSSSSSEDEEDGERDRSKVRSQPQPDEDSSESNSQVSGSEGEIKKNEVTGSAKQTVGHLNLRSKVIDKDATPRVLSSRRARQSHASASDSEDDGGNSSGKGKDDLQSAQSRGNISQGNLSTPRSLSRRSLGRKKAKSVGGSVNQNREVIVSSSEVEERSPVNRGHERLSFPMLERVENKSTDSSKKRKRSFKSPKLPSDTNITKGPKLDETRKENEEKVEDDQSNEGVAREVADYIKQIRTQTTVANGNQPRRSTRIRLSSTSSVESRSDRRENLRNTKIMTLRTRRSTQKRV